MTSGEKAHGFLNEAVKELVGDEVATDDLCDELFSIFVELVNTTIHRRAGRSPDVAELFEAAQRADAKRFGIE